MSKRRKELASINEGSNSAKKNRSVTFVQTDHIDTKVSILFHPIAIHHW